MKPSLLEILRSMPDHRRAEGTRYGLADVLLCTILAMAAGANSYRQAHEFIRIHLQTLNEGFGLALRGSPSYTGVRRIMQSVDAKALEEAFRRHAASIETPASPGELAAIAIDGVIASGNHLLVQIKGNQPKLRGLLERAAARRSPGERDATGTKERNRWETQEL
jgi:hypothetical protein